MSLPDLFEKIKCGSIDPDIAIKVFSNMPEEKRPSIIRDNFDIILYGCDNTNNTTIQNLSKKLFNFIEAKEFAKDNLDKLILLRNSVAGDDKNFFEKLVLNIIKTWPEGKLGKIDNLHYLEQCKIISRTSNKESNKDNFRKLVLEVMKTWEMEKIAEIDNLLYLIECWESNKLDIQKLFLAMITKIPDTVLSKKGTLDKLIEFNKGKSKDVKELSNILIKKIETFEKQEKEESQGDLIEKILLS